MISREINIYRVFVVYIPFNHGRLEPPDNAICIPPSTTYIYIKNIMLYIDNGLIIYPCKTRLLYMTTNLNNIEPASEFTHEKKKKKKKKTNDNTLTFPWETCLT